MHDTDAATPRKLNRLAREINQQIARPYAFALWASVGIALGAGWVASVLTAPVMAVPLAAFAAFVISLGLWRIVVVRPMLRRARSRLRAELALMDGSALALAELCDNEPELRVLAGALRRWNSE